MMQTRGVPTDQTRTIVRDGRQAQLRGWGHPAVMRAWLLQALTGRRASEVLMIDFHPLSDIPGLDVAHVAEGGMVARLRYQQTKIDNAPNTILVGRDVVEIIKEQQAWVRQRWNLRPEETIRYLFPKTTGNRHGTKSWETSNYTHVLKDFSHHPDLRDSQGELLLYSRSHRLRHTKATPPTSRHDATADGAYFGSAGKDAADRLFGELVAEGGVGGIGSGHRPAEYR
ncbi:hypothetical protein [Acrocarpospora sp. B8E8]|uniref:hypothetical protein n=1 Tax=Acrocarpospora sp. B8E8 TaxID=3153572 RepID=UPI00325CB1F5